MKRPLPLILSFAALLPASPAPATMNAVINPLGATITAGTTTGGNTISLQDLQALVTARADLSTAAVLSIENDADDTQITLTKELGDGGALFNIAGPNTGRWSRIDSAVMTSGTRFAYVSGSESWTIGTAVPNVGATHLGMIIRGQVASQGLVKVTATFSDGMTEVYTNQAIKSELEFVGFAAPQGTTITGIRVEEPTGGSFLQYDDLTVVINPPVAGGSWKGAGADAKWSTGANWESGAAPAAGDSLAFRGTLNLNAANDLPAGRIYDGINFLPGAGAFVLSGNSLSPGSYLANASASPQIFEAPVQLTQNLEATISGGAVSFRGVVSGDFALHKLGPQTLTLAGADTFSGPLEVQAGTVEISGDHSGAVGDILVSNTVASTLSIPATGRVEIHEGATLRVGATTTGTAAAQLNVAGNLSGAGTMILSRGSVSSVTGSLSSTGTLRIAGVGGYGATLTIQPEGLLDYKGAEPLTLTTGGANDAGRARLTVDGGQVRSSQPLSASVSSSPFPARLTLTNGGALRLAAEYTDSGELLPVDLELDLPLGDGFIDTAGHDTSFASPISGSGALVKTGNGILNSTGLHTWEGELRVEGGTFALASPVPSELTKVSIANGASLRLDFQDTDTVDSLSFNGVLQATGTWGAPGSGAEHTDTRLSGSGLLRVLNGNAPPEVNFKLLPAAAGSISLSWDHGVLETSVDLIDWKAQPSATSPHTETISGRKFFRVRP